MNINDLTL